MIRAKYLLPPALLLLLAGCNEEDPRIPEQIYAEALKLNQAGKLLEAKSVYEQLASRYPESPSGQQARKDLYIVDALLKQDVVERQKMVRSAMRRLSDALTRYKAKKGEYPFSLQELVPEYLDKVPETPWGHPFFYRAFVPTPIEDVKDRKGHISQHFNTRLDNYHLACFGTDLRPGGTELAADVLIVNGNFYTEAHLPPVPDPQPVR